MQPIETLRARTRTMDLDAFLADFPSPVLIAVRIIGGRLSRGINRSARRSPRGLRPSTLLHIDPEQIDDPREDDILVTRPLQRPMWVPIIKKSDSAPEAPIAVGRFANCDVVINDYTISKQHACITIDPLLGGFRIMDVGSTNGSAVADSPIEPGQAVAVSSGQTITFGRLIFKILSATDFYQYLTAGARTAADAA